MLSLAQVVHLNDRRIDLGLAGTNVRLADEHRLDALLIRDDPIECALFDAASPLADRESLKPQDLAELPFRFMDRETNPAFYDAVMAGLEAIGISPRLVGSYNGPRSMWRAAADLGGWALGTRSLRARPFPGMVAIPVEGFHIPSGLRLLWRRDEADPAVLAVRDAFRDLQVRVQ